jgi:hypothetical protein
MVAVSILPRRLIIVRFERSPALLQLSSNRQVLGCSAIFLRGSNEDLRLIVFSRFFIRSLPSRLSSARSRMRNAPDQPGRKGQSGEKPPGLIASQLQVLVLFKKKSLAHQDQSAQIPEAP